MFDAVPEASSFKLLVFQQIIHGIDPHHRDVGHIKIFNPFRSRAGDDNLGKRGVNDF